MRLDLQAVEEVLVVQHVRDAGPPEVRVSANAETEVMFRKCRYYHIPNPSKELLKSGRRDAKTEAWCGDDPGLNNNARAAAVDLDGPSVRGVLPLQEQDTVQYGRIRRVLKAMDCRDQRL